MYLSASGQLDDSSSCLTYEDSNIRIVARGFILFSPVGTGNTALAAIADHWSTGTMPFEQLRGNYSCFVHDKTADCWTVFADAAHQERVLYSAEGASDSLLRLLREQSDGLGPHDPESIVAYLMLGGHMPGLPVYYADVHQLGCLDYIVLKDGRFEVHPKKLQLSAAYSGCGFVDLVDLFMDRLGDMLQCAKHTRLCFDMTGGTDSRLLVAAAAHCGLEFEGMCLGDDSSSDVAIGASVAEHLGRAFHHYVPVQISAEESFDRSLFEAVDGMRPATLASSHAFERQREKHNFDVVVDGDGGPNYKDCEWTRYALRSMVLREDNLSLFRRCIHSLVRPSVRSGLEDLLSPSYVKIFRDLINRLPSEMDARYKDLDPIAATDLFYNQYANLMHVGTGNRQGRRWSPLNDPALVNVGLSLPLRRRLLHGFHRHVISRYDPVLASMPTDRANLTMSTGTSHVLVDAGRIAAHYLGIRQRKHIPNTMLESQEGIRRLPSVQRGFEALQELEVFAVPGGSRGELPLELVGRISTFGHLIAL